MSEFFCASLGKGNHFFVPEPIKHEPFSFSCDRAVPAIMNIGMLDIL